MNIDQIRDNQKDNLQLWLAAIKLPIYSVAIIPISAGTAIAFAETNQFSLSFYFTFAIAAVLIIAWLNLSNDVFDAATGIDINKAHSVVNLTGKRSLIFWLSNLCLLAGFGGVALISWWQQDWTVLSLILLCAALGYTYQGPPFRLGYLGLGEIICFFTFGPGAVSAAYYAQTQSFSKSCLAVSFLIGIGTSIILFCSHFHQVDDDLAAGKKSPIVRLGTARGAIALRFLVVSLYVAIVLFSLLRLLPLQSLIFLASTPIALKLVNHVSIFHNQPDQVSGSKFIAVNLYLVSSLLLIASLIF